MKLPTKTHRPIRWNPKEDAQACCGCGRPFTLGDFIYPREMTVGVSVHYLPECAVQYNRDTIGGDK